MTVKTIFKTLIGTIVLMVVISLTMELFNVQIASLRLTSLSKLAVTQSAELFAQESYKADTDGRAKPLKTLRAYDGSEYISGNVYGSENSKDIWLSLYGSGNESYKQFSNQFGKNWYSLDIMSDALKYQGSALSHVSLPSWGSISDADMAKYNKAAMADTYYEMLYTPLNMGIPYLGEYSGVGTDGNTALNHSYNNNKINDDSNGSVLDRIFRWNLTQLLSNCDSNRIIKDENGNYYVQYSGFRCYTRQAEITGVTYQVYDVKTQKGKEDFMSITNIDPADLGIKGVYGSRTSGTSLNNLTTTTYGGSNVDERSNICVAFISYSMPVAYEGITPIKNVFESVWKNEVQGLEDSAPNLADKQFSYQTQNLMGGAYGDRNSLDGVLPTTGSICYYIVR